MVRLLDFVNLFPPETYMILREHPAAPSKFSGEIGDLNWQTANAYAVINASFSYSPRIGGMAFEVIIRVKTEESEKARSNYDVHIYRDIEIRAHHPRDDGKETRNFFYTPDGKRHQTLELSYAKRMIDDWFRVHEKEEDH